MENTKIEWATHTFSPWHGCAKVSPGCKNCYADAQHSFHYSSLKSQQGTCWGVSAPRLAVSDDTWKKPLRWNRAAQAAGVRARVFCASMADVFEPQSALSAAFAGQTAEVPKGNEATRTVRFVDVDTERLRLLRLIYDTPHLDWLLLTKRPENIKDALYAAWCSLSNKLRAADLILEHNEEFKHCLWLSQWLNGTPPANVWLGTSVENQEQADARIPHLLATPAAVRFLSCEPLLGPVVVKELTLEYRRHGAPLGVDNDETEYWDPAIDWVIVGGESGPKARPMHPEWVRGLRNQCEVVAVSFFFKQWGEYEPYEENIQRPFWEDSKGFLHDGHGLNFYDSETGELGKQWHPMGEHDEVQFRKVGKHIAGRQLDGRTWDEVPTPQPAAQ